MKESGSKDRSILNKLKREKKRLTKLYMEYSELKKTKPDLFIEELEDYQFLISKTKTIKC